MNDTSPPSPQGIGLFRRLAVIVYDAFLLLAVLFIALLPTGALDIKPGGLLSWLVFVYMLGVGYVFYGWFWTHGGQTLGMKTWRVRVECLDGGTLGWRHALIRYASAVLSLGLGLLWVPFHPQGLALQDQVSGTRLVRVEKE